MNRDDMLSRIDTSSEPWDFIIIGGGATGVGTAIEASSRGYRTLLLEQDDFAKGTSSRSTKLAHGGVRYLQQGNISLVLDALNEWWAVVQKSAVAQGYSVSEMCQQQYMQIYHLLYYDLLGKEDYDEKEADSEGLEEWTKDSGGAGTMERGAFLDALFEVCDVYTETMNPQDYSDWLRALLRRLLGPERVLHARTPWLQVLG